MGKTALPAGLAGIIATLAATCLVFGAAVARAQGQTAASQETRPAR